MEPSMASSLLSSSWNPLESPDWDKEPLSPSAYLRIKKDLSSVIVSDPLPGIIAVPHENDITRIDALITGPFDTPYCGGFFLFSIRCPPDYPIRPPRVKLITTGNETVRFNPNLYKNGKVCLSILGTWAGPSWSPALTLSTVLLSIQSLLNEKPFYNEPGYGKDSPNVDPEDVHRYNQIILHETIRVGVCDMIENVNNDSKNCPQVIREAMEKSFIEFYPHYEEVVRKNLFRSNLKMIDPFVGEERGIFDYNLLLSRLEKLKEKFKVSAESAEDSESDMDD